MSPEKFETSQWVEFPVELVFAFFANPANLPHLMPPRLKVKVEELRIVPPPPRPVAADPGRRFQSLAAGVGTEIGISFQPTPWLPNRLGWTARIVEFVWNSHFIDEQARGPFALFHHRHGIEARMRDGAEGTWVSDRVEFALPGGWLGKLAAGKMRRELEQQFTHRQARLPEILASAARQARQQA